MDDAVCSFNTSVLVLALSIAPQYLEFDLEINVRCALDVLLELECHLVSNLSTKNMRILLQLKESMMKTCWQEGGGPRCIGDPETVTLVGMIKNM